MAGTVAGHVAGAGACGQQDRAGVPCCALVMGQSSKERSYAQDLAVLGLIMGFVRLSAGTEGTSGPDVPPEEKAQKHEC